jgi:hypothetical protein
MTLDKALSFVIDYTKFITALWASYIAFNVTIIGWLLTLRGTGIVLGWLAGIVVIVTYIGVSFIFREVLRQNHKRLLGLMDVVDILAEGEAKAHPELNGVYGRVFKTGDAKALLERTAGPYLSWVTVVAALFMALITFLPKPPIPPASSPAATQAAPAR